MESPDEKLSRVRQMVLDNGQTWDLSPNDKAALTHVLGMVNYMAEDIAERWGLSFDGAIEHVGNEVETIQNLPGIHTREIDEQDGP